MKSLAIFLVLTAFLVTSAHAWNRTPVRSGEKSIRAGTQSAVMKRSQINAVSRHDSLVRSHRRVMMRSITHPTPRTPKKKPYTNRLKGGGF